MKESVPAKYPVVIVDDEPDVLAALSATLESAGYDRVFTCPDSRQVVSLVLEQEPSALLLDLNMPHLSGCCLLSTLHDEFPDLPIIIVTAVGEIEMAVKCMRLGAFDYLAKPIERNKLLTTVRRAVEIGVLPRENAALAKHLPSRKLRNPLAFLDIRHLSSQMGALLLYAESIAPSPHTVLITGETGTGKELFARAIHRASGRSGELVSVNVAGFDETMFSDSLFGHVKGAFTGADRIRPGLIEKAAHGTLFLDEIGDLRCESQVKLLRLLESGDYYPLGADSARQSDARVLVATNKDLSEAVAAGTFRKDLFFRLKTHHLHIPPLRERPEDVQVLLEHYVRLAAMESGKEPPAIPSEVKLLLRSYPFPGNVRELQALIFDTVNRHHHGPLSWRLFEPALRSSRSTATRLLRDHSFEWEGRLPTIREATGTLVHEALKRANGKQAVAARLLGISPQALSQRLKRV